MEAIVDWRKSASSTGTFVSIIMTGTVYESYVINIFDSLFQIYWLCRQLGGTQLTIVFLIFFYIRIYVIKKIITNEYK